MGTEFVDRFNIGSKIDIAIIVIALLGLAIIFLWVAPPPHGKARLVVSLVTTLP